MLSDTRTAGQLDQIREHTQSRENSISKYHQQKQKFRRKDQGGGREGGREGERKKKTKRKEKFLKSESALSVRGWFLLLVAHWKE